MYVLIDVYFNPTMDNYIDVRIHKEALTKSGYTLKYEVCNYEKEINITDDPIEDFTTSVPIPIDEYERIVEANINKFDNDMNNPANVSYLLIIKSLKSDKRLKFMIIIVIIKFTFYFISLIIIV